MALLGFFDEIARTGVVATLGVHRAKVEERNRLVHNKLIQLKKFDIVAHFEDNILEERRIMTALNRRLDMLRSVNARIEFERRCMEPIMEREHGGPLPGYPLELQDLVEPDYVMTARDWFPFDPTNVKVGHAFMNLIVKALSDEETIKATQMIDWGTQSVMDLTSIVRLRGLSRSFHSAVPATMLVASAQNRVEAVKELQAELHKVQPIAGKAHMLKIQTEKVERYTIDLRRNTERLQHYCGEMERIIRSPAPVKRRR